MEYALRIKRLVGIATEKAEGVIRRARMIIRWSFNAACGQFAVDVYVGGLLKTCGVLIPLEFGRMFLATPGWVGG